MKLNKEEKRSLISLANEARRRAYAPYSNYRWAPPCARKAGASSPV